MGSEQEARAQIDRLLAAADPRAAPRRRVIFAFQISELLAEWVNYPIPSAGEAPSSFFGRNRSISALVEASAL